MTDIGGLIDAHNERVAAYERKRDSALEAKCWESKLTLTELNGVYHIYDAEALTSLGPILKTKSKDEVRLLLESVERDGEGKLRQREAT